MMLLLLLLRLELATTANAEVLRRNVGFALNAPSVLTS